MKKQFIQLCTLVLFSATIISCEKDYGVGLGPLEDSVAPVPVTVTNATFFERYPVVTTSLAAGGNFTIDFEIPADKGRIKEITKVATGPSAVANFTNLNSTAATSSLNSAPIAGNGSNKISFTSSVTNYLPYRFAAGGLYGPLATAGTPPVVVQPLALPAPASATAVVEVQYYFRFTLEDGTTVIPMPVRVRFLP